MKRRLNSVVYTNSLIQVVYMDFGPFFGELYALFDIDAHVLSRRTVITARKRLCDAIHEADYIYSLHLWGSTH